MFWNHEYVECIDPETIQSCALTCKFWHAIARRHIFRAIVLKSWAQLQEFVSLVLDDKSIIRLVRRIRLWGSLPPFDKSTAGQVLPPDWGVQDRWIYYFPYALASLRVCDQPNKDPQTFNVKTLELFDFGHVSGAVEDCEWFGFWIRHLPWLTNVENLYLHSCELASNALGAIVSCFPRLRRVGLTNIDLTGNNHAIMLQYSESPPTDTEEQRLERLKKACKHFGLDFEMMARTRIRPNGVVYWVPHTWPQIEVLYVNQARSEYTMPDIAFFDSWLHPPSVAKSLRRLELSRKIGMGGVARLLNSLGPSPVLEHLRMWVGCVVSIRAYLSTVRLLWLTYIRISGTLQIRPLSLYQPQVYSSTWGIGGQIPD